MKKYRVNVNGTVYEVELEEMTGAPSAPAAPAAAADAAQPDLLYYICRQRRRNGDYYEKQYFSENRILRCFNRDKRNAYGPYGGFHA